MLSHRGGVAGASRCAAAALISWNRVRHGVRQDNWSEGQFECSWPETVERDSNSGLARPSESEGSTPGVLTTLEGQLGLPGKNRTDSSTPPLKTAATARTQPKNPSVQRYWRLHGPIPLLLAALGQKRKASE